jgi:hypothetical protein
MRGERGKRGKRGQGREVLQVPPQLTLHTPLSTSATPLSAKLCRWSKHSYLHIYAHTHTHTHTHTHVCIRTHADTQYVLCDTL